MIYTKLLIALGCLSICLLTSTCRCNRSKLVVRKILIELPDDNPVFSSSKMKEHIKDSVKNTIFNNANFHFDSLSKDGAALRLSFLKAEGKSSQFIQCAFEPMAFEREQSSFVSLDLNEELDFKKINASMSQCLQNLANYIIYDRIDEAYLRNSIEEALKNEHSSTLVLLNAVSLLSQIGNEENKNTIKGLLYATDDISVANACLLGLGQFGDEDSMQAIIDFAERKPAYIRRQAVVAAKQAANPLALSWLLLMAYGHEDAVVRSEALEAFLDLEEKLKL